MKRILILGAGTAGTMMANHLRHELKNEEAEITIVDERDKHYYQPGYLFLPFDIYQPDEIVKEIEEFIPAGVKLIKCRIDKVFAEDNYVMLDNKTRLNYDVLIVATGARIAPEEIAGMQSSEWHKSVFDFYTSLLVL